ncbi:unnamed protein product [Meloidogyne enterolobii]|uniref:Uncharacterized protein n=1 Tax=Meloidogyne enterolobii TaxID=390850 RepID=A0ACB1A682_MELEN
MYYSKLFFVTMLIILFTPSTDAFFSAFFQKIKNNILGGENEISGNNVDNNHQNNLEPFSNINDNPNLFNEKNENFVTEKMGENKGEDEQKHLLGGYYDQKYQHFGFGGPKKEENIVKENEKLNDKQTEIEEIEKVEEGNEEENEEDRLFARIANWFKQNAAEILYKGKNFFKKGKKSENVSEETSEK